jgi:hypothetical protein
MSFGTLIGIALMVLGLLAFRGNRPAYVGYIVVSLLFIPVRMWFQFDPQPCELAPSAALILFSVGNYSHIVLFTIFGLMTLAQFRNGGAGRFVAAAGIALMMGALVEAEEALFNRGHCRIRDLVPDMVGFAAAAGIWWVWRAWRERRVRIGSPVHLS